MKAKIVYLQPQSAGLFRSKLRSDTLWGALCWAMRMVEQDGGAKLGQLLAAYAEPQEEGIAPFYLSSAFPYLSRQDEHGQEQKRLFLPYPLEPYRDQSPEKLPSDPQALKELMRIHKKQEKRKQWISWEVFSARFCGGPTSVVNVDTVLPRIGARAMAHSSIDRTRLGTLDTKQGGLLYHTNENYLYFEADTKEREWSDAGLYFLVQTEDFAPLEPALRFLEDFGLAGDRSTGKGHFRIEWQDIEAPEASEAGEKAARLCLSLYHPTQAEAQAIDNAKGRLCRYKLEDRQGRYSWQKKHIQTGHFCFAEGSVFPRLDALQGHPGQNKLLPSQDGASHPVYRYGHGFMLDIKIP
jgi:CRISPR-associated protein Csm4